MAQSPPTQKLHIRNPVKDDANNISLFQLCIDDINGIRPKYDHKYCENGRLLKILLKILLRICHIMLKTYARSGAMSGLCLSQKSHCKGPLALYM